MTRSLANVKASTKLPVTEHVSETQQGLATIRAYGQGDRFERRFDALVDDYSKVRVCACASVCQMPSQTTTQRCVCVCVCVCLLPW